MYLRWHFNSVTLCNTDVSLVWKWNARKKNMTSFVRIKIKRSCVPLIVLSGNIHMDHNTNARIAFNRFLFFTFFVWRWFLMTFIANLIRIVTAASWFYSFIYCCCYFFVLFHFYFSHFTLYIERKQKKMGLKLIRLICVINHCRALLLFFYYLEICHI